MTEATIDMTTTTVPKAHTATSGGREEFAHTINGTIGKPYLDGKDAKFFCRGVNVFYAGAKQAIFDVSMDIGRNEVIAMIGPSGCGKSTFLRCLNRMNDTIAGCKVTGDIKLDGEDIHDKEQDPVLLRARVGMVFKSRILSRSPSTTT